MPFFSVIISVYNKEQHIAQTIESVLNQTFKDFEIIIVNDGSTDKSEAIINRFKDHRIKLLSIRNQGASNARNTGIKEAVSDYIALLDGDDTWHVSYLQYMFDAIRKFPNSSVFSAAIAQKYDEKIVPVSYAFKQLERFKTHNFFEASEKYAVITSSSVVFKTSILEKTGLFETSIISGQDTDLWIRFGMHYNVVFINKVLVYYIFNSTSLSNTTFDAGKKPKFDKYYDEEQSNIALKKFLDRNRYSMAILSKVQGDKKHFNHYTSHLDASNLSFKQNALLNSPKWLLKLLIKIKSMKGEKVYYPNN